MTYLLENLMTDFNILDQSGADVESMKTVLQRHALQFQREKTALKYYMLGKGYVQGIRALSFIEQLEFRVPEEKRYRKDKVTPSLHHQVRIALSVTQLKGLPDDIEELCIVIALLHDCQEDYDIPTEQIIQIFGEKVSMNTWALTKKFAGEHKNKETYIRDIAKLIAASLVKGLDRCDNLEHMIDVFSTDKMDQYSTEAETVFLKMLKTAMKLFPEYQHAYQTIALRMKHQIKMVKYWVSTIRSAEAGLADALEQIDTFEKANAYQVERIESLNSQIKSLLDERDAMVQRAKQAPNQNLIAYCKTSDALLEYMKVGKLSTAEVTAILYDVTVALGISTLDLANFKPDTFSEGTTVIRR
jgi:hypothetical protein